MPVKSLNFTKLSTPLWDPQLSQPNTPILEVYEDAPAGLDRDQLKTTITPFESPNPRFNAYTAKHDSVTRIPDTYSPFDPNSDETYDQYIVRRRNFEIFEFQNNPGQLYSALPLAEMKRFLNRWSDCLQIPKPTLARRSVNLRSLEAAIQTSPSLVTLIRGYNLAEVILSTPVSMLDVDSDRTQENIEIQDAKRKAGKIRFLKLAIQADNQMVQIRIGQNGTIRFADYPGHPPTLEVLDKLEPLIDLNSIPT